ncbi:hypothetical protein ACRYCC_15340 [Actinomadura scrupuli]|uniref:hypothetical protein n=1 Tax=Actinomadura scrupuli TaxID=559629 RepID=UPI003D997AE7
MSAIIHDLVIEKTHRLPLESAPGGAGSVAARQFDAVLMSAGFKLSRELLAHLSGLAEGVVIDLAVSVLPVIRRMAGDHVQHNTYFKDFPANVPGTLEFWVGCLVDALLDPVAAAEVAESSIPGALNLLALPKYGRYLHTYEEMLAAHEDLIPAAGDRVTVLHLGGTLDEEAHALYLAMAGSQVPLSADDLSALQVLAEYCLAGPQPQTVPMRESRAVINRVLLLGWGVPLLVDTVTDVLRLACALSDGDVTLQEPTRFRSFGRRIRRALLAALEEVVEAAPAKLGDVGLFREQWKRLGERLHPHEFPQWPHAAQVFAVARGEQTATSFNGRVEAALNAGRLTGAVSLLGSAPGLLFRSLDRLMRTAESGAERDAIVAAVQGSVDQVSGRVVLSVREHLQNRAAARGGRRVFANSGGRAWVAGDTRAPLAPAVLDRVMAILDADVRRRLPKVGHLVIDPAALGVALPLSGKATASGLGVLPRGSVSVVDGELLRFFIYWRERERTTDFDLSALMLDADYANPHWLSWTNLTDVAGEHSGDITSAPDGASEFINLDLSRVSGHFIIPQVLVYAGEGFDEVGESFFGFMLREAEQQGRPFEPATVRMRSDLRGPGRVALPLVFCRGEDGRWRAKWLHLSMKGHANFNQIEGTKVTTGLLVRNMVEREYLRIEYITDLLTADAESVRMLGDGPLPAGPVTYIGLERPDGLDEQSVVYTLKNLSDLIPA